MGRNALKFDDFDDAFDFLMNVAGYQCISGMLFHKEGRGHEESRRERAAIDYLCSEWDFGWTDDSMTITRLKRNE